MLLLLLLLLLLPFAPGGAPAHALHAGDTRCLLGCGAAKSCLGHCPNSVTWDSRARLSCAESGAAAEEEAEEAEEAREGTRMPPPSPPPPSSSSSGRSGSAPS